ncbi:MAG: radical SAM protein [Candidatus Woesearchaeota archaeon]
MEGYVKNIELSFTETLGDVIKIQFQGCNLNCPFCPRFEDRIFSEKDFIDFLHLKRKIEEINNSKILIYGGEPLLQDKFLYTFLAYFLKFREIWLQTNLYKPEKIKELIAIGLKNYIINWWSYDSNLFNKLTNSKNFFNNEKIQLYDVFYSLHILKKEKIVPMFKMTIVPGIFYTKDHILNEIEFISNFGFYPTIIITPINPNLAKGRYKQLNHISNEYLENLKQTLFNAGYKAIIDPYLF